MERTQFESPSIVPYYHKKNTFINSLPNPVFVSLSASSPFFKKRSYNKKGDSITDRWNIRKD